MVKFACCIPGGSLMPEGIADIPESPAAEIVYKCRYLLSVGYDYTECGGGMLAELDDSELEYLVSENEKSPLKLLAVNSMFPGHWRLADKNADRGEYLSRGVKIFGAMEKLGAKYAVFGSGSARTVHEENGESCDALLEFIIKLADEAEKHGITLLIEPLRKTETNIFVTVPESGEAVRKIAHPAIRLLIDSFHMAEEKSDVSCVRDYMDLVDHCHISESPKRTVPGSSDSGDLEYNKAFARELIKAGYDGCVSVESHFSDFKADSAAALNYLRGIFK